MTISDLNRAIQNIDDRYLEIADAPEEEMIQMTTYNKRKKFLMLVLAACMVMALGITAIAFGSEIVSQIFGWGNNMEVSIYADEDGAKASKVMVNTDNLTEPVEMQDGRMIFIVNEESIDITDKVSTEEAYEYEYMDADSVTHFWLVGLMEEGNPESYGYAEYLKDAGGAWISGYSARVNIETDGHTSANWLEKAKKDNIIPW